MIKRIVNKVLGPRVPADTPPTRWWRYALPTVLFVIAAAILVASYTQPYWNMTLHAPQYPSGLHVQAYLDRLEGDVDEIDGLNHYIGMRPLGEAAQLEREFSAMLIAAMGGLVLAAVFVHSKWAALLALPALVFPAGFLADLYYWLNSFGQNLDPTAALSNSVKPFTPPVLGEGMVGNFKTVAAADTGWYMALLASIVVLVGLFFHRMAYKPLVDRTMVRGGSARGVGNGDGQRETAKRVSGMVVGLTVLCAISAVVSTGYAVMQADDFDLKRAVAEAESGATIHVPAGVHAGPIEIAMPLSLIGAPGAVIDGGGDGHVVHITASDVTIRGFTVRNSGSSLDREHTGILVRAPRATIENNTVENTLFGISLKQAPNSVVRGNSVTGKPIYIARRGDGIRLWASHDVLIEHNTVRDVRDAVMWYSDRVTLRGNHVSGSRYGLHFMYSHDNVLEQNVLEENSVGAFLMYSRNLVVTGNVFARNRGPSGYGLGLKDMQGVRVEHNHFIANRVGAYLDNPPVYLPDWDRYTKNVFAYNDVGIVFQPSVRRTAVYENSFIENQQQVAIWGGGELRDNTFTMPGEPGDAQSAPRGNFWSDYRGFDLAGDGIGDLPYQAESLWDNLMDREPNLRLFLYSPVQQAVDLAAQAFPVVRPRALIADDAPLMRPVRADVTIARVQPAWPTWLTAGVLLSLAALGLYNARPQTVGGGDL